MSDTPTPFTEFRPPRSRRSILWICLSFLLSAIVLGWTVSLPFRQGNHSLVSSERTSETTNPLQVSRVGLSGGSSSDTLESAIQMDREFMKTVAKLRPKRRPVPNFVHARKHWNQRLESANRELAELEDAEEGSLEWRYRERLLSSLEDRPQ